VAVSTPASCRRYCTDAAGHRPRLAAPGEFLWACLQRLQKVDRPDLRYLVALDRGHSYDVAGVANQFRKRLGASRVTVSPRRHSYKGNSHNVLESYRDAVLKRGVEPALVHLVEEDILVGAGYFDFHDQAHALHPDAFAVSACRNQQYPIGTEPPQDPTTVYRRGATSPSG
jgi:hypothetical protein